MDFHRFGLHIFLNTVYNVYNLNIDTFDLNDISFSDTAMAPIKLSSEISSILNALMRHEDSHRRILPIPRRRLVTNTIPTANLSQSFN